MKQRRVLFLGGTAIQIPILRLARARGLYIITCDNRPDNPGHALSDEYHNVSITDPEAVFQLARSLDVDAVVCYVLEAGVQSAAYACEKLGLPTSPYQSVRILSNKRLFRQFLSDNGFCVPRSFVCHSAEEGMSLMAKCLEDRSIALPVVVKPCDLWGSRGVTKVDDFSGFDDALRLALDCSRGSEIIVEEYVEADGSPVEGDGFAIDGQFAGHLWGDCFADDKAVNPITPVGYYYPSAQPAERLARLDAEIQRLISLLGMRTNAYNIEARFDRQGRVYLMEVAPRNGGNEIPLAIRHATGIDLMEGTLNAALGESCESLRDARCDGRWVSYMVHSNEEGIFRGYDEKKPGQKLVEFVPYIKIGEKVHPYSGTNCQIGVAIYRIEE
ncbi:MAG: ATP-grasp domain-containing protein [Bacteroidales bacterium]|nr:ATP-grasp domain-containing protein [Candidatus Liminaster caballi]